MIDTDTVININNLSKRYIENQPYALKDLKLDIKRGEVFGFLGPNGAGKSTTIRMLLNFIQPTKGTATINGLNIVNESVIIRQKVGYLSGDFSAYGKMTGHQFLDYMASLQPLKQKGAIADLASRFQINLNKKIRDLSKGNRQKIGVLQAFMHDPEILILDEPTDGLDPLMQEEFYKLVSERQKAGATFFISSHNLNEVQKICSRVGIIRSGILVEQSNISDLRSKAAQRFEVVFESGIPLKELKKLKHISKLEKVSEHTVVFSVKGEFSQVLSLLGKSKVVSLKTVELNLEDEFKRFYEREKTS